MTGTSCDGADGAVLKIDPETESESLYGTYSRKFPANLRLQLRKAQSGKLNIVDAGRIELLYSDWLAQFCSQVISKFKLNTARTLCSIHGQTVWHEPPRFSIQLGEPARIAIKTGLTTIARFRQPDLALGGQGAPLVPYYHWLRAKQMRQTQKNPFSIHNIGGISNLTVVTHKLDEIFAFDTGPGNALIDLAVEKVTKGRHHFDRSGRMAESSLSQIDWGKIEKLSKHPYFCETPPKSTGRELFNEAFLRKIPGQGARLVANATAFTAHTVAKAYRDFVISRFPKFDCIYIAGGGAANNVLVLLIQREIDRLLPKKNIRVAMLPKTLGPLHYLEAMAFARLGYEALKGREISLGAVTGARSNGIGAAIIPGKNFQSLLRRIALI